MATTTVTETTDAATGIKIVPFEITRYTIRIEGDSSLIVHRWSEKAKRQMLDVQQLKPKNKKEARDPEQDYLDSLYRLPGDKYGFPTVGLKAAIVGAGRQLDMKMVFLRGVFHIMGDYFEIEGIPEMREDMVRVGMGTADLRYRGEFNPWAAEFIVRLNTRAMSIDQLIHLIKQAGFSVGIGEWRPEKDGPHGMFHVVGVSQGRPE